MHSARVAAQAQDADAFNQYVDYPKVRESLKGQFAALVAGDLAGGTNRGPATTGRALGALFGMALADRMIESLVRPEVVMAAMNQARIQGPDAKPEKSAKTGGTAKGPWTADAPIQVAWSLERKGMNRVIALVSDAAKPTTAEAQIGFVFDRSGFADWKLTEIRLPPSP